MAERRLYAGEPMRGDYNPFVGGDALAIDDHYPDEEPAMHWTDGFPHDFHGWGPLAPDYSHEHPDDQDQNKQERKPGDRPRGSRKPATRHLLTVPAHQVLLLSHSSAFTFALRHPVFPLQKRDQPDQG